MEGEQPCECRQTGRTAGWARIARSIAGNAANSSGGGLKQCPTLNGIHHITAIAADPQPNVDFYMGLLGLRLIKKTVNFDDPGSYHLYYGDDVGSPGTIMTFFSWPGAPRGQQGAGQVAATSFAIPATSLDYWAERFAAHGVQQGEQSTRFGDTVLPFTDPDGLLLELIGTREPDARRGWTGGDVPAEHAVRGFHGATLLLRRRADSARLLGDVMGFQRIGEEGHRTRFAVGAGGPGAMVDLVEDPGARNGQQAAGTVHHIAWRTPNDTQQVAWRDDLLRHELGVTDVRDRQYFHSIYYREPGGVLYEIATDAPGFTVDEAPEALGTSLKLPPWLERQRAQIEKALPPIHLPHKAER